MEYQIHELARLAGVSVRTLHYYDEIGLLSPARREDNGYRYYTEKELLKLQQIIFFRELDFDLKRIQKVLDSPRFDAQEVLADQKELLRLKQERLGKLIRLIDKTMKNMKDGKAAKITEKDLRECFAAGKYEEYKQEAEERWGKENIWRSENIVKGMSKEQLEKLKTEGDAINRALVENMAKGAGSPEVQEVIGRHFRHIIQFYDPSWPLLAIYRGLGKMYVEDPRFRANYAKYHPGLPEFMRAAMEIFCGRKEGE